MDVHPALAHPALAPLVAVVALVLLAVTIGCLLADRAAGNRAWRRIAEERRRIHTQHPDDHVPPPPAD